MMRILPAILLTASVLAIQPAYAQDDKAKKEQAEDGEDLLGLHRKHRSRCARF
jgi:hypothetical protein